MRNAYDATLAVTVWPVPTENGVAGQAAAPPPTRG